MIKLHRIFTCFPFFFPSVYLFSFIFLTSYCNFPPFFFPFLQLTVPGELIFLFCQQFLSFYRSHLALYFLSLEQKRPKISYQSKIGFWLELIETT